MRELVVIGVWGELWEWFLILDITLLALNLIKIFKMNGMMMIKIWDLKNIDNEYDWDIGLSFLEDVIIIYI